MEAFQVFFKKIANVGWAKEAFDVPENITANRVLNVKYTRSEGNDSLFERAASLLIKSHPKALEDVIKKDSVRLDLSLPVHVNNPDFVWENDAKLKKVPRSEKHWRSNYVSRPMKLAETTKKRVIKLDNGEKFYFNAHILMCYVDMDKVCISKVVELERNLAIILARYQTVYCDNQLSINDVVLFVGFIGNSTIELIQKRIEGKCGILPLLHSLYVSSRVVLFNHPLFEEEKKFYNLSSYEINEKTNRLSFMNASAAYNQELVSKSEALRTSIIKDKENILIEKSKEQIHAVTSYNKKSLELEKEEIVNFQQEEQDLKFRRLRFLVEAAELDIQLKKQLIEKQEYELMTAKVKYQKELGGL